MRFLIALFLFFVLNVNCQDPAHAPTNKINFGSVLKFDRAKESVLEEIIASLSAYSIGDPTAHEQIALEYANRARSNPIGEGSIWASTTESDILASYSYFGVDLSLFRQQMSNYSVVMPLSFNANLIAAARAHCWDMLTNCFQGHIGSDGSNPGLRLNRHGYYWNTYGENAAAYARTPAHNHAGYEVDWGAGPGGMQTPPGHRLNIHNGNFREAGIGVYFGLRCSVGPTLSVQEFSSRAGIPNFLTGVIYIDLNGNSFYDVGEGVGGILCLATNSSYYAVSASSGGWSIPANNGSAQISFIDDGTFTNVVQSSVNGVNKKVDLKITPTKPQIIGKNYLVVGQTNSYTISGIFPFNSEYEIIQSEIDTNAFFDGAENGTNNFQFVLSTNYSPIVNHSKYEGTNSFRFVHPQPTDQFAYLIPTFQIQTNTNLKLYSRLSWATTNQVGKVEYSVDEGLNWNTLRSFVGTSFPEPNYSLVNVNLGFLSGKDARFRLLYDHNGGSYYYQTSPNIGWYVDSIALTNIIVYKTPITNNIGHNKSFKFSSLVAGDYFLKPRLKYQENVFPSGDIKKVSVLPYSNKVNRLLLINDRLHVEFKSFSGATYDLEWSYDFRNWAFLRSFIGNGEIMQLQDSYDGQRMKYYRILTK